MKKLLFLILCMVCSLSLLAEEEKNAIIVCENGVEMFDWDLDFLREAKHSVEIGACFFGGEIAQTLLKEVEARLEKVPDLQVYILTTPVLLEDADYKRIEHLRLRFPDNFHLTHSSTVSIVWPDVSGIDNHVKMFVVDEKYFSAGGTNLDEAQVTDGTYTPPKKYNKISVLSDLPPGMRDQDVVGRGPIAKQMRTSFYKLYALWEHYNKTHLLEKDPEKFANNSYAVKVTEKPYLERFEKSEQRHDLEEHQIKLLIGGPHQYPHNSITHEYVRLIKEAKEEIIIANMYFCPVDPILKALIDAVNRGVRLTLITNGVSDVAPQYTQYFCWANRIHYVPVFYGGTYHFWDAWSVANKPVKNTHIYEYNVQDILLHKKMMIVDNRIFVVGSYNLGERSDIGDYELALIIDSKEVAQAIRQVHERDKSLSREVTPKEARGWYFDPIISYVGELQKRFHGLL